MAKAKVNNNSVKTSIHLPECPVCLEIMTSPIFQCQSGHSLCHLCTEHLIPRMCPMCRQPMTQMRNWQLEEIVDKAKVPCPNKSMGCIYTLMASEVQDHVKECIFRDLQCPHGLVFGRCSWSGSVKMILDHFKDKHPENCYVTLDTELDVHNISTETDDRLMFILHQGKFLFIFTIKIDTRQKMVYYVIQHIGNKRAAQQYVYEVNICSKQDNRRKVIFTDHCFSDGYDINEIFNKGKCGIMPLSMLSHFIKNNTVSLKVTITKSDRIFRNNKLRNQNNTATNNNINQNKQPNFRAKSPGPHMRPNNFKGAGKAGQQNNNNNNRNKNKN